MNDYKLAIIHGKDDEKRNIKAGQMEKVGNVADSDVLHVTCLLDYAKQKYPDIEIFHNLNYRHRPETVGYFFTLLGDAIFFNTTKNVAKYGKEGMLMLPQEISPLQKEKLFELSKTISDFSLIIISDLTLEDGFVMGENKYPLNKETPCEMLTNYFSSNEILPKSK